MTLRQVALMSLVFVLSFPALSGCKTTAEIRAAQASQDKAECRTYGFEPGTALFLQCIQILQGQRAATYESQQQRYRNLGRIGSTLIELGRPRTLP